MPWILWAQNADVEQDAHWGGGGAIPPRPVLPQSLPGPRPRTTRRGDPAHINPTRAAPGRAAGTCFPHARGERGGPPAVPRRARCH